MAKTEYDDILVPTDGSGGTERAVEHALNLADTYDATIHIIYVIDMSPSYHGVISSDYVEELEEEGRDAIDAIAEQAEERNIPVEQEVARGIPSKRILRYADGNDIDLIAMGTHGRTGIGHLVLGSVTEKIVRRSDVPVLTARLDSKEALKEE